MLLTSTFLAAACGAQVSGPQRTFDSVVTDSRMSCEGGLFVALRGENFDGNQYVAQAIAAGARGVLVSSKVTLNSDVCVLTVDDTLLALQAMARAHRARFTGHVVGITGSNGKTTTKQLAASVLRAHFGESTVLATEGSLNNHFGVPLTLLRLTAQHRAAVIEMGMNHFNEISLLTRIAQPHVAVITNAAPAHLEGVGSMMGVAKAKGEIFEGLVPSGVAVINADDEYNAYWRVVAREFTQYEFGVASRGHVTGVLDTSAPFEIVWRGTDHPVVVNLPLRGTHNRMNALAVAAVARALDIPNSALKQGLESANNVAGRLTELTLGSGVTVLDDSYNANPASMRAAAHVLCDAPSPRVLVLGDMAELGANSAALHRQLAVYIAALPIDRVLTCGAKFAAVNDAFEGKATSFTDVASLGAELGASATAGTTILVKGANSMQMWRVLDALRMKMKELQ
jgi:UDP-N-acetylmuramoyl-tripeptide--D-alanyl-D-alanine ligase